MGLSLSRQRRQTAVISPARPTSPPEHANRPPRNPEIERLEKEHALIAQNMASLRARVAQGPNAVFFFDHITRFSYHQRKMIEASSRGDYFTALDHSDKMDQARIAVHKAMVLEHARLRLERLQEEFDAQQS